ncbi:methionine ABC transporter permease [Faecalicatena contorta]|uniref:D-methionine transport system permease protein n=1 Tax=Faecalicatena contorta TaxID=39482 RepID=A0A316A2X7_9FIRM|nr:ABC transporter permease subunit [Faecalicatena contorta]PWJ51943.1 D-methionine transport system permease protein [Faecalicatena contorta]SUQ12221.1 D-methionine transport system permease protein [Faecalicatena contorta]
MADTSTISGILRTLVLPEMWNTIYMLLLTSILSMIFGCIVALIMICTRKGGLHANRVVFIVFETVVDLLISMPFIVLAVALTPLTVLIVGTSIGKTAALVPLTFVTTPVFAKFIYDGMLEVNPWLVQAAKSFGASDIQILRIMVKDSVPSIISGATLSCVTTLSSIAMMGAIGAGGVGAVAIIYGYQRSNYTVIWVVVGVLAVITQAIQIAGEYIYKKWR